MKLNLAPMDINKGWMSSIEMFCRPLPLMPSAAACLLLFLGLFLFSLTNLCWVEILLKVVI